MTNIYLRWPQPNTCTLLGQGGTCKGVNGGGRLVEVNEQGRISGGCEVKFTWRRAIGELEHRM